MTERPSTEAAASGLSDPITFAVVKSALDSIADEMAHTVMRTARSPIVRDVLDYSATLCDPEGQIIAQAKTIGTYEISILPDQDCCQLFIPSHPATRPCRAPFIASGARAASPVRINRA